MSVKGLKQRYMGSEVESIYLVEKYKFLIPYYDADLEGFIWRFGDVGSGNNNWRCMFTFHQAASILRKDQNLFIGGWLVEDGEFENFEMILYNNE